jgi:two-component system response regulator AdeR
VREKNCDLVLLDIQMPRRDGWSVLDELKAIPQLKNIPVLMWTALPRVGDESKAREMGASDFLVKPVSPEDLLSKIDVLLSKS